MSEKRRRSLASTLHGAASISGESLNPHTGGGRARVTLLATCPVSGDDLPEGSVCVMVNSSDANGSPSEPIAIMVDRLDLFLFCHAILGRACHDHLEGC